MNRIISKLLNKIIIFSLLTVILLSSSIAMSSNADTDKKPIAPSMDLTLDPQFYIGRYNNEPKFKEGFDKTYPEYPSMYHASVIGLNQ